MLKPLRANAVWWFSLSLALGMLALCMPLQGWGYEWPPRLQWSWWHDYLLQADYLLTRTPPATPKLAFIRPAILSGEWWRLLTGHFIHLNFHHALSDSAGLLIMGFYFRQDFSLRDWVLLIVLASVGISAGLWWWHPELVAYVGFSGVLHALLFAGILRSWSAMPMINGVVMALMLARLCYEQSSWYDPAYMMGWLHGLIAPEAHLYGAVIGLCFGGLGLWLSPGNGAASAKGQALQG